MVSANQMKHFVTNWDKERTKGPFRLILLRGSLFAAVLYIILSLVDVKAGGFREAFFGSPGLRNFATGAIIGLVNAAYHYWSQERTWRRYQQELQSKRTQPDQ